MRRYEMRRQDGQLMMPGKKEVTYTLRDFWDITDNTDEQNEAISDLGLNCVYVLDDGDAKFDILRIE